MEEWTDVAWRKTQNKTKHYSDQSLSFYEMLIEQQGENKTTRNGSCRWKVLFKMAKEGEGEKEL